MVKQKKYYKLRASAWKSPLFVSEKTNKTKISF